MAVRAVIVAGGPEVDLKQLESLIRDDDLLVIADGGLRAALALDLTPAGVLGDFDSASPAEVAEAERRGWPLTRVPRQKDQTDTELAVNWALEQGASSIVLAGATGGRLDHTLANVMLLASLTATGIATLIIDGRHEVRALTGGELVVDGEPGTYFSLIPVAAEVTGVNIEGAEYSLNNATLNLGETLAVSNGFCGASVRISCKSGLLLVVTAKELRAKPNDDHGQVR